MSSHMNTIRTLMIIEDYWRRSVIQFGLFKTLNRKTLNRETLNRKTPNHKSPGHKTFRTSKLHTSKQRNVSGSFCQHWRRFLARIFRSNEDRQAIRLNLVHPENNCKAFSKQFNRFVNWATREAFSLLCSLQLLLITPFVWSVLIHFVCWFNPVEWVLFVAFFCTKTLCQRL